MAGKDILVRLTKEEFSHLSVLAKECELSPVSYVRLMLEYAYQGYKLSKQLDKVQKGELKEIELNGYGYGIDVDEFNAFIGTMEKAITGLNLTEKGVKNRVKLKRKFRAKSA